MIHAYNEEYLSYARNLIGKMFDFAVYDLGYNLKDFFFTLTTYKIENEIYDFIYIVKLSL